MLDWLIVGGGIHGVVLATALLTCANAPRGGICIIDPHPHLLAAWKRRTAACGMEYLRSPSAHGLEPDFASLPRWAAHSGWEQRRHTVRPYGRPSLAMFNAYADHVVARHGLAELHQAGRVTRLTRHETGWIATAVTGTEVYARRVILATGGDGALMIPTWARDSRRVHHVYDERFDRGRLSRARRPVVVGGGVAAVQLAIWCARQTGRRVNLLSRSPLRVAQFDSDPCYMGPACMERFVTESSIDERRRMIAASRNPGSVPGDAVEELGRQVDSGHVVHRIDEVTTVSARRPLEPPRGWGTEDQKLILLTRNGLTLRSDYVALATGFLPCSSPVPEIESPPERAGAMEDRSSAEGDYQMPRNDLTWMEGLYVTGQAAELQLGPSAPNIVGAHNAAKRIISSLNGSTRMVPAAWHRY